MTRRFENTVAIVTGASRGIGLGIAQRLVDEGAKVAITARGQEALDAAVETLGGPEHAIAVAGKADQPDHQDEVIAKVTETFGPVDILVNNAGFSVRASLLDPDLSEHDRGFEVMQRAVLKLGGAAARAMSTRGQGWIINISSVSAMVTQNNYSAIKAWVANYSESLSVQLSSSGVLVTTLFPGWVRTEFHARAGISGSSIPDFLWLQADDLVEEALKDLARGRVVSIPTLRYKAIMLGAKLAPRAVVRKCSGMLMGSRANETPLAKPAASGSTSRRRAGQGKHA